MSQTENGHEAPEHTILAGSLQGVVLLQDALLPDNLVCAYIAHLGFRKEEILPDLAGLIKVQNAHIDRVTYENLDLQLPEAFEAPLEPEVSARRIAESSRGGYCFVKVGAYAALLRSVGFRVSLHVATCGPDPPPAWKRGNHVVCVVHLDEGPYISDVGLGDGPRSPFALKEGSFSEDQFSYSLESRGSGQWRWEHDPHGSFEGFCLDYSSSVTGMLEFQRYHHWYCTDAASPHRGKGSVLQKMTPTGVLELRSRTFSLVRPRAAGGEKREVLKTVDSHDDWVDVVRQRFGVELDHLGPRASALLWQKAVDDHQVWQGRAAAESLSPKKRRIA